MRVALVAAACLVAGVFSDDGDDLVAPPGSRVAKCRNPDCTEAISVVRALQPYNWPGASSSLCSFFFPSSVPFSLSNIPVWGVRVIVEPGCIASVYAAAACCT